MYHDCGYFYFFNIEKFIKKKKLITNNTGFFEIPRFKAIDIDDEIDLKIAKKLFKKWISRKKWKNEEIIRNLIKWKEKQYNNGLEIEHLKNDAKLDGQWINLIGKCVFIENRHVFVRDNMDPDP